MRLDEVVLRALEKEPERRYQQAGEIKTQIETIAATPSPAIGKGSPLGWSTLVARRDGERIINWRGVIIVGFILTGMILASMTIFGLLLMPERARDNFPYFLMSSVALALLCVLGGMSRDIPDIHKLYSRFKRNFPCLLQNINGSIRKILKLVQRKESAERERCILES